MPPNPGLPVFVGTLILEASSDGGQEASYGDTEDSSRVFSSSPSSFLPCAVSFTGGGSETVREREDTGLAARSPASGLRTGEWDGGLEEGVMS
jgi:hypothetical protein